MVLLGDGARHLVCARRRRPPREHRAGLIQELRGTAPDLGDGPCFERLTGDIADDGDHHRHRQSRPLPRVRRQDGIQPALLSESGRPGAQHVREKGIDVGAIRALQHGSQAIDESSGVMIVERTDLPPRGHDHPHRPRGRRAQQLLPERCHATPVRPMGSTVIPDTSASNTSMPAPRIPRSDDVTAVSMNNPCDRNW